MTHDARITRDLQIAALFLQRARVKACQPYLSEGEKAAPEVKSSIAGL
jgi:hypothetical protein